MFEGEKKIKIKKLLTDLKLFALINWPVQSNYMLQEYSAFTNETMSSRLLTL